MSAWRLLAAAIALVSCSAEIAQSPSRNYGAPRLATQLSDKEISESSGVARSYKFPGSYYTHNDSGDSARFWRFDLSGKVEGPIMLQGARALDWEDMASARIGDKSYLYFADIGDNLRKRTSVQVYRVEEPAKGEAIAPRFDTFDLKYPEGVHDAEALLVHPMTGEMAIVIKEIGLETRVYGLEAGAPPGSHTLKHCGILRGPRGNAPLQMVTGGDVSPDGRYVVVRNYSQAFEYGPVTDFSRWFDLEPRVVRLAEEPQGEAIAYALDGRSLVTTTEGAPCAVSVVRLRESRATPASKSPENARITRFTQKRKTTLIPAILWSSRILASTFG